MRPILWGTIWFVIGFIGWITFSVIGGITGGITGEVNPTNQFLMYIFGLLFFFSIPVAIIFEIIRWRKKRKKEKNEKSKSRAS